MQKLEDVLERFETIKTGIQNTKTEPIDLIVRLNGLKKWSTVMPIIFTYRRMRS